MFRPFSHLCMCCDSSCAKNNTNNFYPSEQLVTAKQQAEVHVTTLRGTLADLDELGEIMAEMLDRQDAAQVSSDYCIFCITLNVFFSGRSVPAVDGDVYQLRLCRRILPQIYCLPNFL